MNEKRAIIAGAGPAGLTAAYELLHKTKIKPIIYEMSGDVGGISKTVVYKGNRIDIGGHRFFSKSERVMQWWFNILPLQGAPARDDKILERDIPFSEEPGTPDPEKTDKVMLVRERLSRIFFLKKFFDYPLSLDFNTLSSLGLIRVINITLSYIKSRILPVKPEKSLEDFFINRFGRELYLTFFKDYTQKVWGVPCSKIGAQWGVQRIKGLSISRAIAHAAKSIFSRDRSVSQKKTETSLIERFVYPKYGPGQMWEEVAAIVKAKGGELHLNHKVVGLKTQGDRIVEAQIKNEVAGEVTTVGADYFFSTMPVVDLIDDLGDSVPGNVRQVAGGLSYRNFITVGLLLKKLRLKSRIGLKTINGMIPYHWVYIQDPSVKIGRIQIFNNWSPYMVKDENTVWIGLEYFCNEGDRLWSMSDKDMTELAVKELVKIGFIQKDDVLDSTVIRMSKTYPAYFGTYDRFDVIRNFTDGFENMFLVGRNGMHKYNNTDHSMLSAMVAVENIINDVKSKDNLWTLNTEQQYHEQKLTSIENLIESYIEEDGEDEFK
ncbi:MAG: NAD(P)/FAD-dependent oxidoreductase [Planctomycetota bacterium]|jgi:protoporphyrinogen oxidase